MSTNPFLLSAKILQTLYLSYIFVPTLSRKGKASPREEILHNIDPLFAPKGQRLYNHTFDTRVRAAIRVGEWKLITGDPGEYKI